MDALSLTYAAVAVAVVIVAALLADHYDALAYQRWIEKELGDDKR